MHVKDNSHHEYELAPATNCRLLIIVASRPETRVRKVPLQSSNIEVVFERGWKIAS